MRKNEEKITVLFLCTGNACRSQMAEGWAKSLKSDVIDAYSAGVIPIQVSARAIEVMADAGVDISDQFSKNVECLSEIDFDYVITLCDNAKQQCPVLPGKAVHIHRTFEDPYFASGTDRQVTATFKKVRDQIKAFIDKMPQNLKDYNQHPKKEF
jgi:arsenate reductase